MSLELYLKKMIHKEHSKAQMLVIVDWVGEDKKRFNELVKLFISKDLLISQRAGYPLSNIAIKHPAWVLPHLGKIISFAQVPGVHDAVRRNTVRILEHVSIPKKVHGIVMNLCFDFISNPNEKVAVKAFSLTILEHMIQDYPEIGAELKIIIEDQWDFQTPAFRVRAKKILNKLKS